MSYIDFSATTGAGIYKLTRFQIEMRRQAAIALKQSGEEFVRTMTLLRFRGYTGTKGDRLQSRSGRLQQSLGYQLLDSPVASNRSLTGLGLAVFSAGVPYAKMQEYGGIQKPKADRKYLVIPLEAALTPAGRARYPTGRPASYLRQVYPGRTFVLKTKRGDLFIVSRGRPEKPKPIGKGTKARELVFLFRIVKQVTIPPRLKFRKTWHSLRAQRMRRLRIAIKAAAAAAGVN